MLNVLIPMAGRGQRFVDAGYKMPKPLIDVCGKPLIQRVVESLGIDGKYIFCVLKEHIDKFKIDEILRKIKKDCEIVVVDDITEGAVSTCLLAERFIWHGPLIIANSDQIVSFDRPRFLGNTLYYDGCILTFPAFDKKWSFVLTDHYGRVNSVVEKEVVSTQANCGIYSWKNGADFVKSAKEMIKREIRTNNEFYIAPSYNLLIVNDKHIQSQPTEGMYPCGTPDDLKKTINIVVMQEFRLNSGHIFTRDIV
jgi:dTDP-glucose pyrophosphorylase